MGVATSKSQILYFVLGSILYFSWFGLVIGLRNEHIAMYAFCTLLFFAHPKSRKFFFAFSIFIFYFGVYDSLRAFPNYLYNDVSIEEIYNLEKYLFGIQYNGQLKTPSEFLNNFIHPFFDILSGMSYVLWVPGPLLFALYLYFTKNPFYQKLAFAFVATNIIGFSLYYVYPAAPPWYVADVGFDFVPNLMGKAAGLSRFDEMISFPLYEGIYTKNASVYAAVPSIHCANPTVALCIAIWMRKPIFIAIFSLLTFGIWFGAVYTFHHYLFDVLAGGFLAIIVCFIIYMLSKRTNLLV